MTSNFVWNINWYKQSGGFDCSFYLRLPLSILSGVLQFSSFDFFFFFARVFLSGGPSPVPTLFKPLLEISDFGVRVCSRAKED